MQGSKLARILSTFDKEEWKRFRKYVRSPFFNTNETVIELFDFINAKQYRSKNRFPKKEVACRKLFDNNQDDNMLNLHNTMTRLDRLAEDFLVYLRFEEEKAVRATITLQVLKERKDLRENENQKKILKTHLKNEISQSKKLLQTLPQITNPELLNYYILSSKLSSFTITPKIRLKEYQEDIHRLGNYYLTKKMHNYCLGINDFSTIYIENKRPHINALRAYIKTFDTSDFPLIHIYLKLATFLEDPSNKAYYSDLIEVSNTHSNKIAKKRFMQVHSFIQSCLAKKINNKKPITRQRYFNFFRHRETHKTLLQDDIIKTKEYNNIAQISTKIDELEWLDNFTEEYKKNLIQEDRIIAYNYNKALLCYCKKQQNEAKQYLWKMNNAAKVSKDHYIYTYQSKILYLKIFYELNELDTYTDLVTSFTKLVRENTHKIDINTKNAYLKILLFMRGLSKYPSPRNQSYFEKMLIDVKKQKPHHKEWLIEQIVKKNKLAMLSINSTEG